MKKHIFVIVLALKQLCVHPMLLLQGAYKDNLEDSVDVKEKAISTIESAGSEIPELDAERMMPEFDNQESDLSMKL